MARQYTRESIRREFIAMLDERPLDEITVTDLVARCEINRKTFYYYYQDIYAVLSEIFESELEAVYARTRGTDAWEAGFTEAVRIAMEHKRAVFHVYHSMRREELERYLYTVAGEVMLRYVNRESEGIHASEADKRLIAMFYQCALEQMVLSWIGGGMKEDAPALISRIGLLFDGNIRLSLERSAKLPVPPWKGAE